MTKFDRKMFVSTGAVGGAATGPSKVRGSAEYYREIQKKAVETRRRNKAAKGKK